MEVWDWWSGGVFNMIPSVSAFFVLNLILLYLLNWFPYICILFVVLIVILLIFYFVFVFCYFFFNKYVTLFFKNYVMFDIDILLFICFENSVCVGCSENDMEMYHRRNYWMVLPILSLHVSADPWQFSISCVSRCKSTEQNFLKNMID